MNAREEEMRRRFERETAEHELTILHDDGLYRHLRFQKPDTSFYWFDIVTWPGRLTIGGDVDTYTFARETDMLAWFEKSGHPINAHYWAEKLQGPRRGRDLARSYDHENLVAVVHDWARDYCEHGCDDYQAYPALLIEALDREVLESRWESTWTVEQGRERLEILETEVRAAGDHLETWEWDLLDYDWSYLWICHAIVWGIGQYRAATSAREAVAA